jgi:hypothetical protein
VIHETVEYFRLRRANLNDLVLLIAVLPVCDIRTNQLQTTLLPKPFHVDEVDGTKNDVTYAEG